MTPAAGRLPAPGYPVNLAVAGRRVLVVGAGAVARRKVGGLLDAGADVVVVAPEIDPQIRAWADEGRLAVARRPFDPADPEGAWLVVAATGDPAVDQAVTDEAGARHIWVNAADDPARGSFTLMAVLRRGDLVLAIGTGGRSPALAAHLREHLDEELGPEYETLLDLLAEARDELRRAGRATDQADWRAAFESGIVGLVRERRVDEAKELLKSCL